MTIELSAVILAALILISATIIGSQLVFALRDSTKEAANTCLTAMAQVEDNTARLLHKMESWHETEVAASRAHIERVMESASAPHGQETEIVRQHAIERHESEVVAAQHSTNERMADLHERLKSEPEPKPKSTRTPIKPSKAVQSESAINEGKIPQRR